MPDCYHVAGKMILVDIKAVPGASRTEFTGIKDSRLRIRIAAAPEGGRANDELIAFLAKTLGCAKREISVYLVEKSRHKTLSLSAVFQERLERLINTL